MTLKHSIHRFDFLPLCLFTFFQIYLSSLSRTYNYLVLSISCCISLSPLLSLFLILTCFFFFLAFSFSLFLVTLYLSHLIFSFLLSLPCLLSNIVFLVIQFGISIPIHEHFTIVKQIGLLLIVTHLSRREIFFSHFHSW